MGDEITIETLMNRMPKAYYPEKAKATMEKHGGRVVIQYDLSGNEVGKWIITMTPEACTIEKGEAPGPLMTLTADSQDYKDMITGKANPMQLFMGGKLKLKGDLNLALKFMEFFKLAE